MAEDPTESPRTLFDKIWEAHTVSKDGDGPTLLYIDLQLLHEVTSPQAFEGLRLAGRDVRRPDRCVATVDHNVPTSDRSLPIADAISKKQIETLEQNCEEFGIELHSVHSRHQGIVHVMGPEMGYTQPGMTIVCGDSHTSTHGAFGALAFGIGTSEVEHVLATQCLWQKKPKSMEIHVDGPLPYGVTAKDLILGIIGQIGVSGARGHVVEYTGQAIRDLSMEGRMTVCNMSIEGGARAGMIAPDEKTFEYLRGRPHAPGGAASDGAAGDASREGAFDDDTYARAVEEWSKLPTDEGAEYDVRVVIEAEKLEPLVTWGTTPGMVVGVTGTVPELPPDDRPAEREAAIRALEYMDLEPGTPITEIGLDRVFLGSCTNARIGDLRAASRVVAGRRVHPSIRAMVVPGSTEVKARAEAEGLDRIFKAAGFEWREAGCSMCLGMNPDILAPGERCASTSNRNFEGRQGKGGRTHLVSPVMAAAAAIEGRFVDVRSWEGGVALEEAV